MMYCSDLARSLCPDRDHCCPNDRGDFTADSWCGGFNAGAEAAMAQAIDLRPFFAAIRACGEALNRLDETGELQELLKDKIKNQEDET